MPEQAPPNATWIAASRRCSSAAAPRRVSPVACPLTRRAVVCQGAHEEGYGFGKPCAAVQAISPPDSVRPRPGREPDTPGGRVRADRAYPPCRERPDRVVCPMLRARLVIATVVLAACQGPADTDSVADTGLSGDWYLAAPEGAAFWSASHTDPGGRSAPVPFGDEQLWGDPEGAIRVSDGTATDKWTFSELSGVSFTPHVAGARYTAWTTGGEVYAVEATEAGHALLWSAVGSRAELQGANVLSCLVDAGTCTPVARDLVTGTEQWRSEPGFDLHHVDVHASGSCWAATDGTVRALAPDGSLRFEAQALPAELANTGCVVLDSGDVVTWASVGVDAPGLEVARWSAEGEVWSRTFELGAAAAFAASDRVLFTSSSSTTAVDLDGSVLWSHGNLELAAVAPDGTMLFVRPTWILATPELEPVWWHVIEQMEAPVGRPTVEGDRAWFAAERAGVLGQDRWTAWRGVGGP